MYIINSLPSTPSFLSPEHINRLPGFTPPHSINSQLSSTPSKFSPEHTIHSQSGYEQCD